MGGESLLKINMSSLLNGKTHAFSNSKHTKDGFKQFCRFFDEGKFTDYELSTSDHRK